MLYVAAVVGSLGCSALLGLFGRRLTMFSGGVLLLVGAAMSGFSQKFGLFIFFAFFVMVMSLFINKLLPETK
ncbi:hexose transporter, partial [Trifolium medium]|nr:hexose transporter [Trifolium medium]